MEWRSLLSWSAAFGSLLPAAAAHSQMTGYEDLVNWAGLPIARTGIIAGLASSADPRGNDATQNTNNDKNNWERIDWNFIDGVWVPTYVAKTLTGPGVVTRFWAPHLSSLDGVAVRFYIDGSATPIIDTSAHDLLTGNYTPGPQFRSPLVDTLVGGQFSYEPIVFQNSLRIEMTQLPGATYYQFNYKLYPAGKAVPSYNGSLTLAQVVAREQATNIIANVGKNPAGANPAALTMTGSANSIAGQSTMTLASLPGEGQIRGLRLKLRGTGVMPTDAQLDSLYLRVRYDGNADYAINVPVSSFFSVGHGRADYKSVPMGVSDDGSYYSYWPMPFRAGATVELYNSAASNTAPVPVLASDVEYAAGPVSLTAGSFRAVNNVEVTTAGQVSHQLLHVVGAGQYVGNSLSASLGVNGLTEGDDVVVVDGKRLLNGTGLEDGYNGGYNYNYAWGGTALDGDVPMPQSGCGPFSGLLDANASWTSLLSQYRWLIQDMVPFTSSIDVNIENFGWTVPPVGVYYNSTAFYYSLPSPGTILPTSVLTFTDAHTYADVGDIRVRLINSNGASAQLIATALGPQSFAKPLILTCNTDVLFTAGGTLTLSGALDNSAGKRISVSGGGSLVISGAQTQGAGSLLQVSGSGLVLNTDAGAPSARTLTINALSGSTIRFNSPQHLVALSLSNSTALAPGGNGLILDALNLDTGATLDVTNGFVILHYGRQSPIAAVRHWVGDRSIFSSAATLSGAGAAVALVDNHALRMLNWRGETVSDGFDFNELLLTYACPGDVNLDGTVDQADYFNILVNMGKIGATWFDGDLNADGAVTLADCALVTQYFGDRLGGSFGAMAVAAIPEPAGLGLLAFAGLALLRRRRVA
jgi:hypothetical protein